MKEVASPSVARLASLRAVFTAMLEQGPISRAELSRLTGLSKQTTSEVARALEEAGWIRLRGQTQGAIGRRAATYELDQSGAFALGVDLGGTKVSVAVANLLGAIVGEASQPTDSRGGRHVVRQIRDLMLGIAEESSIDRSSIRAGAMGSPGVIEPATGRILLAPNIPGFDRLDVASAVREALGFAVAIENDVNLAALGERAQDGRRHVSDMVLIALGTGIGMGIVASGCMVRGARGGAGEIAYLPLGGDPFDSRGFRLGTLESAVGSAAILDRYHAFGGEPLPDMRGVFDRLADGDSAAKATVEEVARLLVQAIMTVRAVLDPEIVVLGGSIGARPELVEHVRHLSGRFIGDHPPIEASLLGNRAALVGAVGLGVERLHRGLFGSERPGAGDGPETVRASAAQAKSGCESTPFPIDPATGANDVQSKPSSAQRSRKRTNRPPRARLTRSAAPSEAG